MMERIVMLTGFLAVICLLSAVSSALDSPETTVVETPSPDAMGNGGPEITAIQCLDLNGDSARPWLEAILAALLVSLLIAPVVRKSCGACASDHEKRLACHV